jgi:hypothetical protein
MKVLFNAIIKFFERLFESRKRGVQMQREATVQRILSDDLIGDRHQRFIVKLDTGQLLLVTHNIDIAPRLTGLAVGDRIEFYGEYFHSARGGGIHWTHRDPRFRHAAGWIKWRGKFYR